MPKPDRETFRTGTTLIELFVVLCVLTVAATIILPLMKWGVTTVHSSQQHASASLRFDNAIAQLRADVWQATKLTSTPSVLTLTDSDGKTITWKIGPGDQLHQDQQQWNDLGLAPGTSWIADGSAIRLVIPPKTDGRGKTVTLISQTSLLAGGTP